MRYKFEMIDFFVQFDVGLVVVLLVDLLAVGGIAFVEARSFRLVSLNIWSCEALDPFW